MQELNDITKLQEDNQLLIKRWLEKDNECRQLMILLAPYLGLKQFSIGLQNVWASSQDEAESIGLGEKLTKFIKERIEGEIIRLNIDAS